MSPVPQLELSLELGNLSVSLPHRMELSASDARLHTHSSELSNFPHKKDEYRGAAERNCRRERERERGERERETEERETERRERGVEERDREERERGVEERDREEGDGRREREERGGDI